MAKQSQSQNKKQERRSNKSLYLVLLLLLGISLGFAALTTQLNILGNTTVTKQSWDIHFENEQETTTALNRSGKDYAGTQKANLTVADLGEVNIKANTTEVEFAAKLDLPSDYYEFTVDVVNKGTIDAMLSTVSPITLTAQQEKYLTYSVAYADGTAIEANDALAAGKKVTVRVRVSYKDIDNATFNAVADGGETFASVYSMTYVQATTSAVATKDIYSDVSND